MSRYRRTAESSAEGGAIVRCAAELSLPARGDAPAIARFGCAGGGCSFYSSQKSRGEAGRRAQRRGAVLRARSAVHRALAHSRKARDAVVLGPNFDQVGSLRNLVVFALPVSTACSLPLKKGEGERRPVVNEDGCPNQIEIQSSRGNPEALASRASIQAAGRNHRQSAS
jgi:hypothetical protein